MHLRRAARRARPTSPPSSSRAFVAAVEAMTALDRAALGSRHGQPRQRGPARALPRARRRRRRQGRPRPGRRAGPARPRPVRRRAHRPRGRHRGHGVPRRGDLRAARRVHRVASDDDAVRLANDTEYGLNASVWTRDVRRGRELAGRIEAGTVNVNEGYAATWGSMGSPMGGMKASGVGRRHGREGILKYTESQTISSQHVLAHRAAAAPDRRGVRPHPDARAAGDQGRGPAVSGTAPDVETDVDVVVVGSGFGGSVTALRLAEKGFRVLVLEAGRRFEDADFARTSWDVPRYLWAPRLGCYGVQRIHRLPDVVILAGAGVGGGSLNYANTLYTPPRAFFEDPAVGRRRRLGGRALAALRDGPADARRVRAPVRRTGGGRSCGAPRRRWASGTPSAARRSRSTSGSRARPSTTRTSAVRARAGPAAPSAATAWSAAGSAPRTPS